MVKFNKNAVFQHSMTVSSNIRYKRQFRVDYGTIKRVLLEINSENLENFIKPCMPTSTDFCAHQIFCGLL